MQPPAPSSGLLSQEDRYRMLVDAVFDYAIYMIDTAGIVCSWNSGARRIKQYDEAEILGRSFSLFYTEEDRLAGLPQRALSIAATSGRFEGEGWRVRKDGTRLWALVVIDPIHAADGTLIGFAKVTRDLTERRQAEEALRRSEQQFSLLVQGVTDYALYMLDPTGIVTTWNAGAQRIKGYTPDEVIGQHFSLFFEPADAQAGMPQRSLDIAVREGRFEGEGWRVRKDGSRFLVHVVIDPIRDQGGVIIGFAKITRDVTDSVMAQTALKEAREALYQSQKMESIGQLTGGIAHDFNNLLTVILGSLGIVKKRLSGDGKTVSLLDNAIAAAHRGSSLTQRMLAFARRQELAPEPVDVGTLIRGMSELLGHSLGANISVDTRFPLLLRQVFVDAGQLEMAIMNLMINARDAMPNGGNIEVSAREAAFWRSPESTEEPFICISVADTGTGMDEATLQRAMEPFFTTKGLGKGTGLGLSMIHGLAEQSGGKLVLKSQPGLGTTAELWLPISKVASEPSPIANETLPRIAALPTQQLKVLFVDDDPLVVLSTRAMIEDLGHRVLTASDGDEALALIREHNDFDLVISDYVMPAMSGSELAEQISRLRPALAIIISSGFTDTVSPLAQRLPRLPKPFNQAELARAIASIGS
ncbi:PAS domain S-box protein [Pseudomonas sp. RC10]|uniref:hybrid sensor histidine kinase/response regulator n=1 Tax=Pseudomonas bambusae TaxID=3139142 RepID=UPI00313A4767